MFVEPQHLSKEADLTPHFPIPTQIYYPLIINIERKRLSLGYCSIWNVILLFHFHVNSTSSFTSTLLYGNNMEVISRCCLEIFFNFLVKSTDQMFLGDLNPNPLSSATQLCTATNNRHYFSYVALESALLLSSTVVLILKGYGECLGNPKQPINYLKACGRVLL